MSLNKVLIRRSVAQLQRSELSYIVGFALMLFSLMANAQVLPSEFAKQGQIENTVRRFLSPKVIKWQSGNVINAETLLKPGNGQADLSGKKLCIMRGTDSGTTGLLLDFGQELHGGIQLVTGKSPSNKPVKVRIRFGESAGEAMSDIGGKSNATNDHAMRDFVISLPWLGRLEIGNTGFRFVRIDVLDDKAELQLKELRAIFVYRDIPYLGSFNCSDSLLNKIWLTGAYTVHLNMQDYLWDGIKRDRLVWVGDLHPEVSTIAAVFGNNEVVGKSLDLARDITPLPGYMNRMVSYSMWWIIIQRDWYMHNGNLDYLKAQRPYFTALLKHYLSKMEGNHEMLKDGRRFLDWPSSTNKKAVDAGTHALLIITLNAAADICKALKDDATYAECILAIKQLKTFVPETYESKQAAALISLAELRPAGEMNQLLATDGVKNFSTFFGYYMLEAKAKAGDYEGAIDAIRQYWGGMLALGATTFWEDFDVDWLKNASRIDELPGPGQTDVHGTYGSFCYKGYRHSLSHGWSSGPTPWLTTHVLGIKVLAPGCRTIKIEPHLGDLTFAEGTFPTPYGIVSVKHIRAANGNVQSEIKAPKEVKIIRIN